MERVTAAKRMEGRRGQDYLDKGVGEDRIAWERISCLKFTAITLQFGNHTSNDERRFQTRYTLFSLRRSRELLVQASGCCAVEHLQLRRIELKASAKQPANSCLKGARRRAGEHTGESKGVYDNHSHDLSKKQSVTHVKDE
jgi:hypothetical protein